MDKYINKMSDTHMIEYYSAWKRKGIVTHAITYTAPLGRDGKGNELVPKGQILYTSTYLMSPEYSNSQRQNKEHCSPGSEGKRDRELF